MAAHPPPYPPSTPSGYTPGNREREQVRLQREQIRAGREAARAQQRLLREQYRAAKRRSILGPLLVLALGVTLLLGRLHHLNWARALAWYGRWWPGLLVCAGLILLAEWAWDERTARHAAPGTIPYVRRGIGGGVIFLLILCGIAGSLLQGVTHNGVSLPESWFNGGSGLSEFLGQHHEQDQQYDFALPPATEVIIDSPNGDIVLTGTSTDGKVHILEHKRVYASDLDETARRLDLLSLHPLVAAGGLRISVPALEDGSADLTVTVPPAAVISLNANHGQVRASGLKAALRITANHGDADISSVNGAVTVRLNSRDTSLVAHEIHGDLALAGVGDDVTLTDITGAVSLDGDFYGDTHFERLAGPVRFHTSRTSVSFASLKGSFDISAQADLTGDGVVGPTTVESYSRNIKLEHALGDVSVNDREGTVDLETLSPAANIAVTNENGAVTLTLPAAASATLHVETRDGEIESQFIPQPSKSGALSVLDGKLAAGTGHIALRTSDANIAINKAEQR